MMIIAEIGQNHNGDMGLADEMIHAARENGADVAKFQIFDARALYRPENNPWFEHSCKCELTLEQVGRLKDTCARAGIEFMASVFDRNRVEWLERIGVRRYKVASRSIGDADLLQALSATGKPLIVSLGTWSGAEFPVIPTKASVDFLYCVSRYPARLEDIHLREVDFRKYAGFSDHTIGLTAPMAAFARGARIVEKHFTLDKTLSGPDHACSMTPAELAALSSYRNELGRCL